MDQDAQFERRAKFEGKSVSEWLRDLGAAAVAPPEVRMSNVLDPNKWEPNFGTVVAPEYWEEFEAAAKSEGISIEEWIKQACISQIEIDHDASHGEPWGTERQKSTNGQKRTAAELAASIPGLKVGLTIQAEPSGDPASIPFVMDLARRYHDDPGDALERMLTRTRGEAVPSKMASWHSDKKQLRAVAVWLDQDYPLTDTQGGK